MHVRAAFSAPQPATSGRRDQGSADAPGCRGAGGRAGRRGCGRRSERSTGEERWTWLFVPGGPGLGSESVLGLVRAAGVPGTAWLVDLPGEGSNRGLPQVPDSPYEGWPDVLTEAAESLDDVIMVGHSTGGMFLLSLPELEAHLAGLCLVSSAPHAGWR
ncbi:alpha/beta hydrolase [Streptomyces erythrochromogenes]|uniref:alpha/beta hydrolase n=1 Tax=Streptomyces erythrochromogenes TaxID=285574 RepID=UPI00341B081C